MWFQFLSLKAIEGIVRNQLWIEPVVAKVFESIVLVSLYFQLGSRIFSEQLGFLWGRVTTTNLFVFPEFIVSAFTNSNLSWF